MSKYDDKTTIGGVRGTFQTTCWIDIRDAKASDSARRKAVLDNLLRVYWKPVYCYLRRKSYDNEQSKDLTQGFFQEIVLGRKLIQQADRTKGRFRTFLLFALERYLKSVHRKRTAKKRIPKNRMIRLEHIDQAELPEPVEELSAGDCFNYAWVSALLDKMLAEVEDQCRKDGLTMHWEVFCARVIQPIKENTDPPAMSEICDRYGIETTAKASNMIVAVKRRFQATLRRHLRETVSSEGQVNEELRELMQFFVKKGAS